MRVVSKHHIWVYKDKIPDGRLLPDMHIAMEPAIISKSGIPLQVGKCTDPKMRPCLHVLTDGYPVPAGQVVPERASCIKNTVTPDQRIGADLQDRVFIIFISIVAVERLAQHTVVADRGIIPDLHVVIDGRIIPDPHVLPDLSGR